jgi:hypothetical protein
VLSTARLGRDAEQAGRIAAMSLHLLGHLWGIDHAESGPMRRFDAPMDLRPEPYSDSDATNLRHRFTQMSARRLEEEQSPPSLARFYIQTFQRDAGAIGADVMTAAPWRIPIYLGRLTAAAAVSTVFLLLSSDAWAAGAHINVYWAASFAAIAIVVASLSVFVGQDIGHHGRLSTRSEQLIRTRLVLFFILLVGMALLWGVALLLSILFAAVLPSALLEEWTGGSTDGMYGRVKYASLVASLGVLAAALGGNLEDAAEVKAELFFDEEA